MLIISIDDYIDNIYEEKRIIICSYKKFFDSDIIYMKDYLYNTDNRVQ